MSREQAKKVIEEAERNPGSVDEAQLEEAINVLAGPGVDIDLEALGKALTFLPPALLARGLWGIVQFVAENSETSEPSDEESSVRSQSDAIRALTGADGGSPAIRTRGDAAAALREMNAEDREYIERAEALLTDPAASETTADSPYEAFRTGFQGAVTGVEGVSGQQRGVDAPAGIRGQAIEAAVAAGLSRPEAQQVVDALAQEVQKNQAWAEENPNQTLPPWAPSDLNVALEQQIAVWEEEARALRGTPIGVADDFVAQKQLPAANKGAFGAASVPSTVGVEPRYFDGDQFSLAGLPPEQIVEVQARLEEAGLMKSDSYYAGFWDTQTAQAYTSVLGWANQRGTTADEALDFLVANVPESVKEQRNAAKLAEQFQAPSFVKPDYATLAQDAKAYMRQRLGREPTEEEMRELTGEMSKAYRADFEAEVARQRAEFQAQRQGLETGEAVTPSAVQDVDPQARFRQAFESRFGPEIDRLAALPEVRENMNNVFASLRTMGSLVG